MSDTMNFVDLAWGSQWERRGERDEALERMNHARELHVAILKPCLKVLVLSKSKNAVLWVGYGCGNKRKLEKQSSYRK
jgi:hypothetical protein